MTQPPDDLDQRREPSGPDDQTAPEDQPTIAWTPPEPPSLSPAGDDLPVTPVTPPPVPSPIISASPAVAPDAPGAAGTGGTVPPAQAPVVGWELPAAAAAAPGREGYVIAGIGARVVAYLIDATLVTIAPLILGLFVLDYQDLFRQMIEASESGRTTTTFVMDVTPELALVTLIGLGIQFIYFVGFWTSGGRATPGMRGLRLQVVDAPTGGTLSLTAASKRFLAMGSVLAVLGLLPQLQAIAGIAPFAVSLILLFTAIANDLRQGLHDRWANSLVIRSASSGDGATVVGCLLFGVILIGCGVIVIAVALGVMGPQIDDLRRELERAS